MPTYDYRCEACRHELDAFQSITAEPLKTCPECGKDELRRLIGAGAGIIFKGSGFYETDYKRARTNGDKKSDNGKSDSSSSSESKSDAKSESTSKRKDGGSSSSSKPD